MPARNTIRSYQENSFYHIYNRGVEKRVIFLDEKDYRMFLYYLFVYLADPNLIHQYYPKLNFNLKTHNLYNQAMLVAYALMPNHFHLLVKQNGADIITKLLRQVTNAYTHYFNTRYQRVGPLVQGVFKARDISTDEDLMYITKYIHRNPGPLLMNMNELREYPWTSFPVYLGQKKSAIIDTSFLLSFFAKRNPVEDFAAFVLGSDVILADPDDLLDYEDELVKGETLNNSVLVKGLTLNS